MIIGQKTTTEEIIKIFNIFKNSKCKIRPHFILTGPSGSGKSYSIKLLSQMCNLDYIEVNAAQLTKEGMSGNSLSKVLSPVKEFNSRPLIVFVDEFDKLFISGNNNSDLANETTVGVQNEFLKILESDKTSVFGQYGKYDDITINNTLFIFAGAFNNTPNISIDTLRHFGVKTEFLGRVGLVYNMKKLTLDDLCNLLDSSELLQNYLKLFPDVNSNDVKKTIKKFIEANYENNDLGARMINTLINQYFIKGGKMGLEDSKEITFQNTMSL